jgi:hypothetical protein
MSARCRPLLTGATGYGPRRLVALEPGGMSVAHAIATRARAGVAPGA